MAHKREVPNLFCDIHAQIALEFEQEKVPAKMRQKFDYNSMRYAQD